MPDHPLWPAIATAGPDHANAEEEAQRTEVQLLAINDFHGNLEPPILRTPGGTFIGGAEYLDTHLDRLRATNPNTVVVSAGDLIGASPLLSGCGATQERTAVERIHDILRGR